MIFLIAAAIAAAAPAAAASSAPSPCANLVSADAFVCRALAAQKGGDNASRGGGVRTGGPGLVRQGARRPPTCGRRRAICGLLRTSRPRPRSRSTRRSRFPGLEAEQRGEALLDRARAAEAQNDLITARAKLNEAAASISGDPFYWYFSAALYIREQNSQAAQAAIGRALTLAPADPTILFEAGHVAQFAGDNVGARDYWQRARCARSGRADRQSGAGSVANAPRAAHREDQLAEVVVDRRHDAHLLEGRAAARRAAVLAILAVARADREIALAGGLQAADLDSAVARELLGAAAGIAVASAIIAGLRPLSPVKV